MEWTEDFIRAVVEAAGMMKSIDPYKAAVMLDEARKHGWKDES